MASLGSISGQYFCDENGNALDDGDNEVANRDATLLQTGADGEIGADDDEVVDATTADDDWSYVFDDLAVGDYPVQDRGAGFVTQNVDGDVSEDIDSDANADELTGPASVAAGQDVTDVDTGTTKFAAPDEGLL